MSEHSIPSIEATCSKLRQDLDSISRRMEAFGMLPIDRRQKYLAGLGEGLALVKEQVARVTQVLNGIVEKERGDQEADEARRRFNQAAR